MIAIYRDRRDTTVRSKENGLRTLKQHCGNVQEEKKSPRISHDDNTEREMGKQPKCGGVTEQEAKQQQPKQKKKKSRRRRGRFQMLRQALRHIEEGKCQVADGSGRRRRGDFFFLSSPACLSLCFYALRVSLSQCLNAIYLHSRLSAIAKDADMFAWDSQQQLLNKQQRTFLPPFNCSQTTIFLTLSLTKKKF